jgi:hypothetical protein
MLPAFAFAWWFVALPSPAWSAAANGALAQARLAHEGGSSTSDAATPVVADERLEGDWGGRRTVVKVVTPALIAMAKTFLNLPMGEERFVAIDGHRYVFVLERHYHPPGFVGAPNGWHKGVTVYELR